MKNIRTKEFFFTIRFGLPWLFLLALQVGAQPAAPVRFIHLSDPHICFLADMHPDIQHRRKHYGNVVVSLENFLTTFSARPHLNFITITGDLIDFYQGASPRSDLLENQIAQFVPILQKSKVPVYMNLGNHDVATYVLENDKFKGVEYYAQEARANWIKHVNCFQKDTYYSKMLQVGTTAYRLTFLDNGYTLGREQLEWLEWQLAESTTDVELVLMHIPFLSHHDQETEQQQLFDLLLKHPSTKMVLAGHEHINEVRAFKKEQHSFTQVLTGAFGRDPNNWR